MRAGWDLDTDAIEMVLTHQEYMTNLVQRGIPFDRYSGYDHESPNDSLRCLQRQNGC